MAEKPFKTFLSPQKEKHKPSEKIVGTLEKSLQSAHQATIYHNFLFVHRHLISSFAPLFISQLLHFHTVSALFALGLGLVFVLFLVKNFVTSRQPSYEDYFKRLYWLHTFQSKKIQLPKKSHQQFLDFLTKHKNSIEKIQNNIVIGFINFTLSYLALSQVANFACSYLLQNTGYAGITSYIETATFLGALLIEMRKQQAQERNYRHKGKLLALSLYMQQDPASKATYTSHKTLPSPASISQNTKTPLVYIAVGLTLIGLNIPYLQAFSVSQALPIILASTACLLLAYSLQKILAKEAVRTQIQATLTTYSAGHALIYLAKSKFLQYFPNLVEKTIPTIMSRFFLGIISMYTVLLYLYHLSILREQQDYQVIHTNLAQQITPLDSMHLSRSCTLFDTPLQPITTEHTQPGGQDDHRNCQPQ